MGEYPSQGSQQPPVESPHPPTGQRIETRLVMTCLSMTVTEIESEIWSENGTWSAVSSRKVAMEKTLEMKSENGEPDL